MFTVKGKLLSNNEVIDPNNIICYFEKKEGKII
jgi:hypothetical protein